MFQQPPAMDGSPALDAMHGVVPAASAGELADGAAALLRRVASQVVVLAGGLAVACGGVLLLRRLSGAIATPPGSGTVLVVCAVGLVLVAVGDLAMESPFRRPAAMMGRGAVFLTRAGLLMALAAVCMPPRTTWPLDALFAIATLSVAMAPLIRKPLSDALHGWGSPRRPSATMPAGQMSEPIAQVARFAVPPSAVAGTLRQRFERLALPGGAECVRGRLCVPVAKGARSGSGHVGFCPPLSSQPTVDVTSDYDGVEAVVSAAEVLPWGVRIECRLDQPAEETIEIPVDILVTTAA